MYVRRSLLGLEKDNHKIFKENNHDFAIYMIYASPYLFYQKKIDIKN